MNNAFYLIDKPSFITSFDILRKLKKELGIKKMWHTGTLDPLATGLVLVAVGNYTKLIPYFEKDSKEYEFTVCLDGITESYDNQTDIQYISDEKKTYFAKCITTKNIEEILLKHFTWKIEQLPPKYSALKIKWKKAVDLVRSWIEFELKKREVTIYSIWIIDYAYPILKLRALVSAGTYVRSIAHELWEILWCGWYITELRRTKIGKLDMQYAQKLNDFDPNYYLDKKILFWNHSFIELNQTECAMLHLWKIIKNNFFIPNGEYFVKVNDKIAHVVRKEWDDLVPVRNI